MTDAEILKALMEMSWEGGWKEMRGARAIDHGKYTPFVARGRGGGENFYDLATIIFDHGFIKGLLKADIRAHKDYLEHNFRKTIMDVAVKEETKRLQYLKSVFLE